MLAENCLRWFDVVAEVEPSRAKLLSSRAHLNTCMQISTPIQSAKPS
ncbi:unnamed protein product [Penicillium roqueforti FM164]|uniref:Transposable element n=1 Tax=Penicillium roqueforti (strain FM164) TaxID=1365484 RepID=W6R9M5_PENRF|nr:unnamed protein product [Penicillium roqueforti FM164]